MSLIFVDMWASNAVYCSVCPLCDKVSNPLDWSCAKNKLGYSQQKGCPTKISAKTFKILKTPKGNKRRITND